MRRKRIEELKKLRDSLVQNEEKTENNVKECQKVKVLTRKRFNKEYKCA